MPNRNPSRLNLLSKDAGIFGMQGVGRSIGTRYLYNYMQLMDRIVVFKSIGAISKYDTIIQTS